MMGLDERPNILGKFERRQKDCGKLKTYGIVALPPSPPFHQPKGCIFITKFVKTGVGNLGSQIIIIRPVRPQRGKNNMDKYHYVYLARVVGAARDKITTLFWPAVVKKDKGYPPVC